MKIIIISLLIILFIGGTSALLFNRTFDIGEDMTILERFRLRQAGYDNADWKVVCIDNNILKITITRNGIIEEGAISFVGYKCINNEAIRIKVQEYMLESIQERQFEILRNNELGGQINLQWN